MAGQGRQPSFGKRLVGLCHADMPSNRNSVVQMAKYQAPQRSGDIVMIQSEHTGAVDILSADLESADLLGDHRKGEPFGSTEGGVSVSTGNLKKGGQAARWRETQKVTCRGRWERSPVEVMSWTVAASLSQVPAVAAFPFGFSVTSCLSFQSPRL